MSSYVRLVFIVLMIIVLSVLSYIVARTHNMSRKTYNAILTQRESITLYNNANPIELTRTAYGFPMFISRLDGYISEVVKTSGTYQPEMMEVLGHFAKKGDTVLHFGVHQGLADMVLAKIVGNEGKIYSFEANPELYDIARKNFVINNFDNIIELYNYGVSNKKENLEFCLNYGNTGGGHFYEAGNADKCFDVQLTDVDSVLNPNTKADLLFMDIEGSEIKAIEGIKKIMANSKDMIIILEWNPNMMSRMGSDYKAFAKSQFAEGKKVLLVDNTDSKLKYVELSEQALLDIKHNDIIILPANYQISEKVNNIIEFIKK